MRLLELWIKRHGVADDSVAANFLRFQNSTSLRFPSCQIEALDTEPRELARDARSLGGALRSATLKYVRLTPTFMGLLGAQGALPAHYTERVAAHGVFAKDPGARAFLDAYSTRSLALFYQAWRKYRLELKYQLDGKDAFLPLLLALAGVGNDALRRRLSGPDGGEVLDESIAHFATALRHRPASAVQIARVLADYFGVPVGVEQFVGRWYKVPVEQQTMLGSFNTVLGAGAMAGERVWQRDRRLRLAVGPLTSAQFEGFLPGAKGARALKSLLTMFTGVVLEYEVEVVLLAAEVKGLTLDSGRSGGRLGWDAFLATQPQGDDRRDVRYDIHAL